jgi:hypothetical protein
MAAAVLGGSVTFSDTLERPNPNPSAYASVAYMDSATSTWRTAKSYLVGHPQKAALVGGNKVLEIYDPLTTFIYNPMSDM